MTSKEDAKRILSSTPPEKAFWVNNGPVLKSIIEMTGAMKKLSPVQFAHHVNKEKNDFAKWVEEVIRDSELAKLVRLAKTKEDMAKAITTRLKQLQKLIK